MTEANTKRMRTHHWLMGKSDSRFHAYPSGKCGEKSLCGSGQIIEDLKDMHIPGDRSPCCALCMHALYGYSTFKEKPTR